MSRNGREDFDSHQSLGKHSLLDYLNEHFILLPVVSFVVRDLQRSVDSETQW